MTPHEYGAGHVPRFSPHPTRYIYEELAEHLALRIASGELPPNTPLPSERRLADEYGVSLGTSRHATRLLRYRGLVVTIRSKGTFVAENGAVCRENGDWER